MTILLNNHGGDNKPWQDALTAQLPEMPVESYPAITDRSAIRYAMVWGHPFGDLQHYPNLKAIFSLGAGMEHLLNDPELPDVPLVSLGDPAMSQDMANYALYWVIHFHRHFEQYRHDQTVQHWQRLETLPVQTFKVVVLGLGRIGVHVAGLIQQAGFSVVGWDFKEKSAGGVVSFSGADALTEQLNEADAVINCLALNARSKRLIDKGFMAQMKRGSHLVNISRGDVVDEDALLVALDEGHIKAAALDVFSVEPLPVSHRLWTHPHVFVTPHMAGPTHISSATRVITDNIQRMEQGEMPEPIFDRSRGIQA